MTTKADFTDDEWELLLEGPTRAGMLVILAARGGSFRESFSMSKAYAEARQQPGQSQLIDEIVSSKPKVDRKGHGSHEELKAFSLQQLRAAVGVLETKATADEVDDYRGFVTALIQRVAAAHEEHGEKVSPAEEAVIAEITEALGPADARA